MVTVYLIVWAILGIFMYAQLHDGYYLEDISPKTMLIISIICGPLILALFLFGVVKGLIILLLEYLEDKE